jgi:hypothetical protein
MLINDAYISCQRSRRRALRGLRCRGSRRRRGRAREHGDGVLVKDGARDEGLHDTGVDGDGAVGAGGLAVGGERLEAVPREQPREGVVGGGEHRDAGPALVGLKLARHAGGLRHRRHHDEGARIGEDAGDVDRGGGRVGLRRGQVER